MATLSKVISFLLLILCLNNATYALEGTTHWRDMRFLNSCSTLEKHCIKQVITNDQGSAEAILFFLNGEWMPLTEVTSINDCGWSRWKCEKCGHYNLEGIERCAYCGRPRDY